MAASIAALTAGGGGLQSTSDASGNLNLVSGTTTIVAMTSAGIAVTGTLTASGTTTLVTPVLGTPASADFTTIAATQAQQEAGTALTAPVTPGRQQYHPSAAKAWIQCNFNGDTVSYYVYNKPIDKKEYYNNYKYENPPSCMHSPVMVISIMVHHCVYIWLLITAC